MKRELGEWISKAEGDYYSALREYRARKHPNYDSACFHAQQSVEKYLKAILVRRRMPFRKTHDLLPLLEECLNAYPRWDVWKDPVEWLSQYSVLFRYPGDSASREDARKAIRIMTSLGADLRNALGCVD